MTAKTTETAPKVTPKRSPSAHPSHRTRSRATVQPSGTPRTSSAVETNRAAHANGSSHSNGASHAADPATADRFSTVTAPITERRLANAAFWTSLAVLPLATAGIVRLLSGRSSGARPFVAGAGAVLGLGLVRWQLARWFTEKPTYELVELTGGLEIRDYPPMVVAEASIPETDWDRALSFGFRVLAEYIFGKNSSRERVAMTAPVQASDREPTHERIATSASGAATKREQGLYTVTFVMPEGRSLRSLPLPLDERIRLRHVSSRQMAVLRFAGAASGQAVREKRIELETKAKHAGLQMRGEPSFAAYDAPSTVPLLRRNEVWVEVNES